MFYEMISRRRDAWLAAPDCPVRPALEAMAVARHSGKGLREIQLDAIRTYLFLKIGCGNRPLASLFSSGAFNSLDLDPLPIPATTRNYLVSHPASQALFEFASQKLGEGGKALAPEIVRHMTNDPSDVDAAAVFKQIFYNVSYPDYLFSLPMGAGKTFLMAAFIYLDLAYARNEPDNKAFAHNFIVFAPSGLKSSIIPSLRTIQAFDPAWVLPEPQCSQVRKLVHFELLDADSSANKSNKTQNPNAQKIQSAAGGNYSDLFGLVAIVNAEKVILDRVENDANGHLIERTADEKDLYANELRAVIGRIPSLAILIDEAHHAQSDDIRLRAVVNHWTEKGSGGVNCVLGFSGTPYLPSQETVTVGPGLSFRSAEIANTVYYFPLVRGVGDFLKKPLVTIVKGEKTSSGIVRRGVTDFLEKFLKTRYSNGALAKLAVYCGTIERLEEEIYPLVAGLAEKAGLDPAIAILRYHRGNKQYPAPEGAELAFAALDQKHSLVRIVLLVQIGKEGWDCRSLAGVVLSQEGDCPRNMVLQTSCRCLREVDHGKGETAAIYLNEDNAEALSDQLRKQQHATIDEFQRGGGDGLVRRYDRTKKLELPPLDFCQLRVSYSAEIVKDATPVAQRLAAIRVEDCRINVDVGTATFDDLAVHEAAIAYGSDTAAVIGTRPDCSFSDWFYMIAKESFRFLAMADLESQAPALRKIYDVVSEAVPGAEAAGCRRLSAAYDQPLVRSRVRRAFWPRRELKTHQEVVPVQARLLCVEKFRPEVPAIKPEQFVPDPESCARIVAADTDPAALDAKDIALKLAAAAGKDEAGFARLAALLQKASGLAAAKDRTYHYLPYRTDSAFERTFLDKIFHRTEFLERPLEVFYNGEGSLTEFRIDCYRQTAAGWRAVGRYTPDFLVIRRDKSKKRITDCVIVETKGALYANDPRFPARRAFAAGEFLAQNKGKPDVPRLDYLYLEETADWEHQLAARLDAFFGGGK